jgi:hypothetical protein
MKKTITSGSLPEIAQAIDRAYDLAFSLVSRLRFAESFVTQAAELAVITFFEGGDEEQRIAESVAQAKGKLFDRRSELIELRELIDADLKGLREAFLGVTIEVFEFSYAETNDFETTGDRTVYASLTTLAYAVRKWIGETIGYLGALDCFVNLQKCNDLADGFPMNQNFERAIRKRLLFEKSILTRNAKAYAETKGIIGSTTVTTPQGRKKTEKNPETIKTEKSYLSLLAEYEKWQEAQRKKTGRKRFGPGDWLKAQNLWSSKSKTFFRLLCDKRDDDKKEIPCETIVDNAIKYARKLRK